VSLCVFCRIVSKELEAYLVYEDSSTLAFLDHSPVAKGHVLVVPRRHVELIYNLEKQEVQGYFEVVRRAAAAVKEACLSQGVLLLNNNVVGQSVPHLHFHVVPRDRGDSIGWRSWHHVTYKAHEAKEFAYRIASSPAWDADRP
jgi:histidine triad (HIT) family protein